MTEPMQAPGTNPEPAPQQQQTQNVNEAKEMLGLLEKLGAKTTTDVQNMAVASQQSGRLANMVGELKQTLKARDDQIMRMIAEQKQAAQQASQYYEPPAQNQPVNIAQLVRETIRDYHHNEILKPQMEAQAQFKRTMGQITSDPHYSLVKDIFTAKLQDPDVQFAIQTGETSMVDLFKDTKLEYYQEFMGKIAGSYKGFVENGAQPVKVNPPHLESNQTSNYVPPGTKPNVREAAAAVAKDAKGRDSDIDKLMDIFLPKDDPMMRVNQRKGG